MRGRAGGWGVLACPGRCGPSPSPTSRVLSVALLPSHSRLCGSFPNGTVDHRPCRLAEVPHQRHPPDHRRPQHGCPGCGRPRQEEVTLGFQPLAAHLPGSLLCHTAPLLLRGEPGSCLPNVSSNPLEVGQAGPTPGLQIRKETPPTQAVPPGHHEAGLRAGHRHPCWLSPGVWRGPRLEGHLCEGEGVRAGYPSAAPARGSLQALWLDPPHCSVLCPVRPSSENLDNKGASLSWTCFPVKYSRTGAWVRGAWGRRKVPGAASPPVWTG